MKRSFNIGITDVPLMGYGLLLVCMLILPAYSAWAYRPFVSTDTSIADPKEIEVELGYFNLERARGPRRS